MIDHTLPKPVQQSIAESVLCWLATIAPDGEPHVTPKQMFTHNGTDILVADIASPHTVENIQANHKVCISFINVFSMRGFKVRGQARYLTEGVPNYGDFYAPLYAMAGDDFPIQGVIVITPEHIAPIVAPSYKLFPERTLEERIAGEMLFYGVKPL